MGAPRGSKVLREMAWVLLGLLPSKHRMEQRHVFVSICSDLQVVCGAVITIHTTEAFVVGHDRLFFILSSLSH